MGDSFLSRLTGGWIGGGAAGAGGKTGGAHSQGYRTAGGAALDPIAEARAMSARSNAARRPSSAFALSDSGFNSFRGSLSAGWKAELVSWRFRQAVLAELVGTFLFVAIGTLSVMTTLPGSRMDGLARQEGIPYQMRVALTSGSAAKDGCRVATVLHGIAQRPISLTSAISVVTTRTFALLLLRDGHIPNGTVVEQAGTSGHLLDAVSQLIARVLPSNSSDSPNGFYDATSDGAEPLDPACAVRSCGTGEYRAPKSCEVRQPG